MSRLIYISEIPRYIGVYKLVRVEDDGVSFRLFYDGTRRGIDRHFPIILKKEMHFENVTVRNIIIDEITRQSEKMVAKKRGWEGYQSPEVSNE